MWSVEGHEPSVFIDRAVRCAVLVRLQQLKRARSVRRRRRFGPAGRDTAFVDGKCRTTAGHGCAATGAKQSHPASGPPIVGASVEAAGPLMEELQQRARQRGVALAGSSGQNATHVLKGYFSVLNEDGAATVIYVWDVYDPAGSRLHRISGQQKAQAVNGAEGWPSVAPDTLRAIADATMDQLSSWFQSSADQG